MPYRNDALLNALAAEYELGTLKGHARRRFERLLAERADIAEALRGRQMTLNQLAELAPPVETPPQVWDEITRHIDGQQPAVLAYRRWWPFSMPTAFGTLAAVLLLLTVSVALLLPTLTQQPHVQQVVLHDPKGQSIWLIGITPDAMGLEVHTLEPVTVPAGKRCILWLQTNAEATPVALGVLSDTVGKVTLTLTPDLQGPLTGTLSVSLETAEKPLPERPTTPLPYHMQRLALAP